MSDNQFTGSCEAMQAVADTNEEICRAYSELLNAIIDDCERIVFITLESQSAAVLQKIRDHSEAIGQLAESIKAAPTTPPS